MSKKPFKKPSFSGGPKALLIGIIIMIGLMYALTQLTDLARNMGDLTYKEFLDKVKSDEVKSVVINGQQIEGLLKNKDEKIDFYRKEIENCQNIIIENNRIIDMNRNTMLVNQAVIENNTSQVQEYDNTILLKQNANLSSQNDVLSRVNVRLQETNEKTLDMVRTYQARIDMMNQSPEGDSHQKFQATVVQRDGDFDLFEKHGVDFSIATPGVTSNFWYILLLIAILVILGAASAWYINRQGKNNGAQGGGLFNMGKSRAKIFMPNTIKEKFSSVAGAHEAKEELMDVVDFLKNPGKYRKIGAQIPRGVLLQGHPGTGKTLLARAVAGEAHCPFITVSGSDFVEVFVGVGASRVRDLFAQAKRNAPCIVFIDEIDAVGRQRSGAGSGGSDEREQTLNQLLTEMDGFEVNEEPIIVMAATNRADVLDKALLRPGRFDRIVTVPVPDLISREQILHVHLKKVKLADGIDVHKLARATIGYTGADLANFINTAAILATKAGLDKITMAQFEEARDAKMMGAHAKTLIMSDEEKRVTAYHEGGHTLVNILSGTLVSPLHKVTITPRSGGSLGVTCFLPEREKYLQTKEEHLAYICTCMGGRAAEMLACNMMTAGAGSDFKQATNHAYNMVAYWGMSKSLGMAVYDQMYLSDDTKTKIDVEVATVLEEQYQKAYQMLVEHRDKLEIIVQLLLEKEVVEAAEIYAALGMESPETVKLT